MTSQLSAGPMQCRFQKSLAAFLALSVLTGSVAPPAYSHSHAGGDAPHDHGRGNGRVEHSHGHTHAHPHHADGHQSRRETAAPDGRAAAHASSTAADDSSDELHDSIFHWHVTFWFFDVTLPGLPVPGGGSDGEGKQLPAVARLVDLSRVTHTADGPEQPPLQETAGANPVGNVVAEFARPTRHSAATRVLLCDTARRERSGVLLT